jgi:hypothetical protein
MRVYCYNHKNIRALTYSYKNMSTLGDGMRPKFITLKQFTTPAIDQFRIFPNFRNPDDEIMTVEKSFA